jgi:transposase
MAQEIVAEEALLRLTRLCGINLVTLYGVVAAVGDVRRFSHSKKLVAYFGLNPSVSQSGNFEGSGALKRHGRGALRALLVQSGKKLLEVNNPLQKLGTGGGRTAGSQQSGRRCGAQALRCSLARPDGTCHRHIGTTSTRSRPSSASSPLKGDRSHSLPSALTTKQIS